MALRSLKIDTKLEPIKTEEISTSTCKAHIISKTTNTFPKDWRKSSQKDCTPKFK
jgi:hypothetical protein